MQVLGAGAAVTSVLALCACSDRSAPHEDVAQAALALEPVLGPPVSGWRLPSPGDFNRDGLQDVLWRNLSSNRLSVSLMSGTRVVEQGPEIPGPPGEGWIVISAGGDFNRDGVADLLWHNPTTNRMAVWLMRRTEPFEQGREIPGPPGDGWLCAPARDFNFDGIPDVLWYNPTTNRMIVWLMRGTEPFEQGSEIPGPPGGGWFAGFGADFDRDGMADVFWYNPTANRIAVWLMQGTELREPGPALPGPPGDGWRLTAAGDFNHDFVADELWYNPGTKRMTISLMRGTGILEQGPEIPGPPGEGWIVGNSSDCNGDGMSDVLWLNPSPLRMSVWLMNGTVPTAMGPEIPGPAGGRR